VSSGSPSPLWTDEIEMMGRRTIGAGQKAAINFSPVQRSNSKEIFINDMDNASRINGYDLE